VLPRAEVWGYRDQAERNGLPGSSAIRFGLKVVNLLLILTRVRE
jgi:hypothetical protein